MNNYWELKRNDNAEIIQLPQDLMWIDEFDWTDLAQSPPVYSVGGSVIIQQSKKKSGRPITLGGEWVWIEVSDFEKLQTWSAIAELSMTLTHYNTDTYKVIFRNHEKPIACKPVSYMTPQPPDAPYTGQIKLMTTE